MYARVRGLWRSWPLLLWRMIHLGLKATWRAETTHNWPLYNLWLNIKSKSIQNRTHEIHKIITPVLVWVKLAHPTYIFSRVLRDSTPRYVGRSVGFFLYYSAFFEFCLVTLLLPLSSCTRLKVVMYPTLLIVRVNLWQHFPLKMVKHKMVIPLKRVLKESCSVDQQWKVCQSVSRYRLGYTIFCEI